MESQLKQIKARETKPICDERNAQCQSHA